MFVMLDTAKISKRIKECGSDPEKLGDEFATILFECQETSLENFATKQDLKLLELRIDARFDKIDSRFENLESMMQMYGRIVIGATILGALKYLFS